MGSAASVPLPEDISVELASVCLGNNYSTEITALANSEGFVKRTSFIDIVVLKPENVAKIQDIFHSISISNDTNNTLSLDDFLSFFSNFKVIDPLSFTLDELSDVFLTYADADCCLNFTIFRNKLLPAIAKEIKIPTNELIFRLLKEKLSQDQAATRPKGKPDFPKLGVTLRFFFKFIAMCGGRGFLNDYTTTDACNKIVQPATFTRKLSYCELLQAQGSPDVGQATVFISHAWKFRFLDVVDTLAHHFRDSPDTIIWFDLFSNNQNISADLDFHWWSTTFKSAIEQFHHTVLILSPWNDPIPLTRAWCLFEIYCTVDTKSKFEVAMSPAENLRFVNQVKEDIGVINAMIAKVDLQRSEAWNPADRDQIFKAVQDSVSFAGLNSMVFSLLRDWVVEVVQLELDRERDELEVLSLTNALASIYEKQGSHLSLEIY